MSYSASDKLLINAAMEVMMRNAGIKENYFPTLFSDLTTPTVVAQGVSLGAVAAKAVAGIHAAYAGNDASNDFPGAFTNPAQPRNVIITFAASWDGGDITVVGTDQFGAAQTEAFVSNPGSTRVGTKVFATVTSATKSAVGATANTASIGTGDKLGLGVLPSGTFFILTVDGIAQSGTLDATEGAITATSVPNGALVFRALVNKAWGSAI